MNGGFLAKKRSSRPGTAFALRNEVRADPLARTELQWQHDDSERAAHRVLVDGLNE
jgi:hypothetical protein